LEISGIPKQPGIFLTVWYCNYSVSLFTVAPGEKWHTTDLPPYVFLSG